VLVDSARVPSRQEDLGWGYSRACWPRQGLKVPFRDED
jgi:hypothetical protein